MGKATNRPVHACSAERSLRVPAYVTASTIATASAPTISARGALYLEHGYRTIK